MHPSRILAFPVHVPLLLRPLLASVQVAELRTCVADMHGR